MKSWDAFNLLPLKHTLTANITARIAHAHEFISAAPKVYDTFVGDRGILLSGGQRQRIAIARAIVKDPTILLSDEATASLDTKSEATVQAAIERAASGRTTIVIAHRLSTIKSADNIVVMHNGGIVEQGTHDDLLGKEGIYYGLVKAQEVSAGVAEGIKPTLSEDMTELERAVTQKSSKYPTLLKQITSLHHPGSLVDDMEASNESHINPVAQKYTIWELMKLVGSFNRDEIFWMTFGLFSAILAGGATPAGSVIFAKCIAALAFPQTLHGKMLSDIGFWSGMYVVLAVAQLLGQAGSKVPFAYCAERLIHKACLRVFKTLLRQDIEFFDKEMNNAGELTAFLSIEPIRLAGLSGATLGTILTSVATLVIGIILSVSIAWKIGLVCTSVIPILLATGYLRVYMLSKFAKHFKTAYEGSADNACEAISATRTVASLTREEDVWQNYRNQLKGQAKINTKTIPHSSSLYALSQDLSLCCSALGFWYGGRLISDGKIDMFQFFVAYSAVLMGAQSTGTVFSFAPDIDKAKNAAIAMKALFDREPEIDSWSEEGGIVDSTNGHIEFRDVQFSYPTHPDRRVLTGLSFGIKTGRYVGIVGASGCGKYTIIALLERFHSPANGSIYLGGTNISKLNINQYRNSLALVSQEPTLYQGTIRDNVLLGTSREDVTEEEIVNACKSGNIYDFIMSLPQVFQSPTAL